MVAVGDLPATNAVPAQARSDQQSQDSPRGNRNRNRARGRGNGSNNNVQNGIGTNGDRGGRRGRGGNRNRNAAHPDSDAITSVNNNHGQPKPASTMAPAQTTAPAGEEDDTEAEVCFICASPVVHHSVAPCNHRTCHICALRMRALYKTKDCAHCRTEAPYVIFTDDASKRYEDYTAADLENMDENIGIKYENQEIVEDTLLLLRYNCPDPSCDVACLGWPDLHRHVRSVHKKKMCDLCTRHKKVFTHEHELFADKSLEKHMRHGDDNPGAVDQSGFKGHPMCGFCGERFYGDDELFVHCRAKHERCFICDQRDGRQPQYYLNYEALEVHFRKDHFLCPERNCLEKKFVVFSSEMDLKAHQLQEHGETLSKDVRRDARLVDMSSFDYRAPYQQDRRGGGSQRENRGGRGRGRDPNAEPLPASSAQHLRRDEQAFQRQMAIHSAQSVSNRTFGGQLTASAPGPPAQAGNRPQSSSATTTAVASGRQGNGNNNSIDAASLNVEDLSLDGGAAASLSPQDQARRLRHSAVVERASALLQHDAAKLEHFRTAISTYRARGAGGAPALIDSFFATFEDTSATALGTLVREVADLFEDRARADAVRTAWNDWRAINEDYPSLPGPSGMSGSSLPLGWAQVTSAAASSSAAAAAAQPASKKSTSRVLKLKSSTARSSRSSVSRDASWSSSSSSSPAGPQQRPGAFPSLSAPPSRLASSAAATTPWLPGAGSSSATSATPRATTPASRPAPKNAPRGGAMGSDASVFPALPPAPKPQTTIFGYGTGMVRRDVGGGAKPSAFSWGGGNGGPSSSAAAAGEAAASADGGGGDSHGKKKGNKGKKQVLAQWG